MQHVQIAFAGLLARTSHARNNFYNLHRIAVTAVAIEQDLQVSCPRHDKTGAKVLGDSGIVSGGNLPEASNTRATTEAHDGKRHKKNRLRRCLGVDPDALATLVSEAELWSVKLPHACGRGVF